MYLVIFSEFLCYLGERYVTYVEELRKAFKEKSCVLCSGFSIIIYAVCVPLYTCTLDIYTHQSYMFSIALLLTMVEQSPSWRLLWSSLRPKLLQRQLMKCD